MEADLDLKIYRVDDIPIVDLAGDVDAYTCPKLREAISALLDDGEFRVIISMSRVNYIDSSGLGTLVGGLRRVSEQNGGLVISGASPQVKKVFNITGLNKILSQCKDELSAVKNLKK